MVLGAVGADVRFGVVARRRQGARGLTLTIVCALIQREGLSGTTRRGMQGCIGR